MPAVGSAAGLLALLEEQDDALKLYALENLDKVVHEYWFQIASYIALIETLYEDEDFGHRNMAALVASKVFYHLGELEDALTYALGAGDLFDVNAKSEYVQTILARCVDQYTELRAKEAGGEQVIMDERLVAIVEKMFDRCYKDGQYEHAVGIALEARRIDKLEEAISRSDNKVKTLTYALEVCQKLVIHRNFRQEVLRLLIRLYETVDVPDWITICHCLTFLDDTEEVAKILNQLLKGPEGDVLLAYQVAFDLFENEVQSFLLKVEERLTSLAPPLPTPPDAQPAPAAAEENGEAAGDPTGAPAAAAPDSMETDVVPNGDNSETMVYHDRFTKLKKILSGEVPIGLYLEFLYSKNHADLQVLKNIKSAIEARNSVCHSATIFANAIMHCGTSVDTFLRENLDWLSRATNWAKFSATAGLGVIHKGQLPQSRSLMQPYLPRDGAATSSPYSEGGAMFALGLIHVNHGQDIRGFLLDSLQNTSNDIIQHGACLGLGIAGLGTNDEELFEELKGVLYLDNAVAGEAAGIALGLLGAGCTADRASEMVAYAHDTQHEKIIRGLALGLALIMYGREEGAETLIEQLTRDQDPILRYGGVYVIGLAYRGTANNSAIQKLLHFAVSDVSDDVRRAAVLCLGFVLLGVPHQCPRIVSLLAESFNPHVRYGAAMAVGISCGGSGMKEAINLLEPLVSDAVDFVRQGALIAMALVVMGQPEARTAAFRKQLDKLTADKHEEVMCRMGAIMAAGILDAGGCNMTVGLRSRSGYFRRTSVIGLAVFTQYWYWYPLTYFLSMALRPTALVGLNADLKMPKFSVLCKCKPSTFAYPVAASHSANVPVSKLPTAVLSTTVRAREKARKKDQKKAEAQGNTTEAAAAPMETDAAATTTGAANADADKENKGSVANGVAEPEATSYQIENPARVVPAQEKFIDFSSSQRYVPLKQQLAGIVVLRDLKPEEPVQLVNGGTLQTETNATLGNQAGVPPAVEDEPAPPEPFEYIPS